MPDEVDSLPVEMTEAPHDGEYIIANDDGGVSIVTDEKPMPLPPPEDMPFDANLAEYIPEADLTNIGSDLLQKIKDDIQSNQPWRDTFNDGLKFLGFKPDERDFVFKGASGAWDSKLLEALIRLHAETFNELFPPDGPVKTKIVGKESDELRDQADRIKIYMNYFLTEVAKEYYDDSDQMLNYALLSGSAFRKAYVDPILRRPVAKYMTPNQVAMPYTASSIYDAERFTHISQLTPKDFKILKINQFYRDVDLSPSMSATSEVNTQDEADISGMTENIPYDDEPFEIYETLVDYDLPGFEHRDSSGGDLTGLPLPYRITLDSISGDILRIERNWKKKRQEMTGQFERNLNISHWKFMPGFGPFGIGLIHCLTNCADTRTKIKRMLQDSGVFSNFPPTIRVKGMRMEHNRAGLAPGENVELDTGGLPINNAIQQMMVKEPSMMLYQLHQDEGQAADRLIGNLDIAVGEGRQDAPVGTTIALLQAAKKPQTGVMKRLHRALKHELGILHDIFGQWLPEEPYPFPVPGTGLSIMRKDFDDRIAIIPVSDPNNMSQTERVMRAQMIMTTSSNLPPTAPPYQIEAARRLYNTLNIDGVEKLLPPLPQAAAPTDPITENQNAMTGKPLQAFPTQNHDAHIAVHTPIAEGNPSIQAHISEHMALKYRAIMEQTLGFPLPPSGTNVPPEVEGRLSMMAAAATQRFMDEQKAKQGPKAPTMEEIMVMDVNQKKDKALLQYKETMAKIDSEGKIQVVKSDDAAASRSAMLEKEKLKAATDLATKSGEIRAEATNSDKVKVAHIGAAAMIEVARIKANSDDGAEAYKHERSEE